MTFHNGITFGMRGTLPIPLSTEHDELFVTAPFRFSISYFASLSHGVGSFLYTIGRRTRHKRGWAWRGSGLVSLTGWHLMTKSSQAKAASDTFQLLNALDLSCSPSHLSKKK